MPFLPPNQQRQSYIDEEHRKQTQTKFSTKTDVTMINMQKYNTKTEQKREKSKRK